MDKLKIPKNLKIDRLINRFGVDHIAGFHKDKVYAVLYAIRSQMKYLNRKGYYPGEHKKYYVPLSSDLLKQRIGNSYKILLSWMQKAGLILIDKHYVPKERCMCYRLTDHYLGCGCRWVTVSCASIRNKQYTRSWHMGPQVIQHLVKWLSSDYLLVDNIAGEALRHECEQKIKAYKGDKNQEYKKRKLIDYALASDVIEELKLPVMHCYQDIFGYRLHTPLTRLKKCMRGYISCNGQSLVQMDIKNSQLFFSLWLLNSEHWSTNNKNHREIKMVFHLSGYKTGYNKNNTTTNTIMFLKSLEKQHGKGLQHHPYCKDVCSGILYENIVAELEKTGYFSAKWSLKRKRKKVKKVLLTQLFGNPADRLHQQRVYNDRKMKIWGAFSSLYPEVSDFFSMIKAQDYKELCRLLQRIEAIAIISKTCMLIKKQLPSVPVYTIHDCLLTIPKYADQVEAIMKRSIHDFIGFEPTVEKDNWYNFSKKFPLNIRPKIAA